MEGISGMSHAGKGKSERKGAGVSQRIELNADAGRRGEQDGQNPARRFPKGETCLPRRQGLSKVSGEQGGALKEPWPCLRAACCQSSSPKRLVLAGGGSLWPGGRAGCPTCSPPPALRAGQRPGISPGTTLGQAWPPGWGRAQRREQRTRGLERLCAPRPAQHPPAMLCLLPPQLQQIQILRHGDPRGTRGTFRTRRVWEPPRGLAELTWVSAGTVWAVAETQGQPGDTSRTTQGHLRDNSGLCIWFCPLGPFISRHLGASVQFWGLIKSKNLDPPKNKIIICSAPHCHSTRGPGDTSATSVTADPLLLPRQGRGIPLVGTGTAGLASCPSVGLLPRARAASTPWQCPPWGHQ